MNTENEIKKMHDSIIRTLQMISNDFKTKQGNVHFIDGIVKYILWFEEKYKYKFRYSDNRLYVKKGEIYNCNLGQNIGSEQNECRPVLILQNNKGNLYAPTTVVAPITDEIKANLPTHVNLKDLKPDCNVTGIVLIEQLKCISKKRLKNRLDCIDTKSKNWNKVINALKIELDVNFNTK
jgi:mRNA interferase MazF